MDFSLLVQENTRDNDGYINATKWCKHFGKDLKEFKRLPSTRKLLSKVAEKYNVGFSHLLEVKPGKGGGTFAHPIVALALAEWLSPEFHLFALEALKRYLEGDITLADDILQRASTEDAKWLAQRAQGRALRNEFTDVLKQRGVEGWGFAQNTDAIYLECFDNTAKGLREERQLTKKENLRDNMSIEELMLVGLSEITAAKLMDKKNAYGVEQTTRCSRQAARRIRDAVDV